MGLEKRRSNRAAKEQAKKKCEKKIYRIIGKIVGIAEMIHVLSVLIWGVGLYHAHKMGRAVNIDQMQKFYIIICVIGCVSSGCAALFYSMIPKECRKEPDWRENEHLEQHPFFVFLITIGASAIFLASTFRT